MCEKDKQLKNTVIRKPYFRNYVKDFVSVNLLMHNFCDLPRN